MLCCQAGTAGLPCDGEIEADLRIAGFDVIESARLVPTEPFVGITARLSGVDPRETGQK